MGAQVWVGVYPPAGLVRPCDYVQLRAIMCDHVRLRAWVCVCGSAFDADIYKFDPGATEVRWTNDKTGRISGPDGCTLGSARFLGVSNVKLECAVCAKVLGED